MASAAACVAVAVAAVLAALVWTLWPSGTAEPSEFGVRPPAAGPSAAGSPARSTAGAEPLGVRVPRISLDARIEAIGVEDDGTVEVPADAGRAGWYRHGPPPGAPAGSAVLVGHVDDRTGDLGAFATLYRVREGDVVTVARRDAPPVRYEVTAREVVDKDGLPAEVFRRDGRPVLTLVTCAPPYDPESGYEKNLVVYAEPARG